MLILFLTIASFTITHSADTSGCVDSRDDCPRAASMGHCWNHYTATWSVLCPESCNNTALCHPTLGDTDPICRYHLYQKKCSEHKGNCSYTCGDEMSNMTCPVPDPPNGTTTQVYSDKLLGRMEFHCSGCNGNSGGEQSLYCTENGTWIGQSYGVCTETCHDSMYRGWCGRLHSQYGACIFGVNDFWRDCGKTCDIGALCHRETGETDCQCGEYAQKGQCETDQSVRDRCPYTCHKRKTTSCGTVPEGKFTVASSNGTQYLEVVTFQCLLGYVSLTVPKSVYGCNRFGRWIHAWRSQRTFCVPARPTANSDTSSVTTVFRQETIPEGGLELQYLAHSIQTTFRQCLDQCRLLVLCSHVTLDEQTNNCTVMNLSRRLPRVVVTEGEIWKKYN